MFIRDAFIASLLGFFACASAAYANSCANVDVIGTYDQRGLQESEFGINAVGTFRIAGEGDEAKQPMFNLAFVNCEKKPDDFGRVSLECKLTKAVVWSTSDKPDSNKPNCSLDLDSSTFPMKELQRGVLTGMDEFASGCFNNILTIDRNTKRVWVSFTRTKYADNYDKIKPGTCGTLPRTQVLMNCTGWPKIRKQGPTPPRYCDFSGVDAK